MACCDACARTNRAAMRAIRSRLRAADDTDTKRAVQFGAGAAAESYAPGSGEAAAYGAGKAFEFGASFNKNKDCVPGEDPNDPECDGSQVVTGVRICGPNEDPTSSGCVRDTNTRGTPATSAFPNAAIDVTGQTAREAERTQSAQRASEAAAQSSGGAGAALAVAGVGAVALSGFIWYATTRGTRRRKNRR